MLFLLEACFFAPGNYSLYMACNHFKPTTTYPRVTLEGKDIGYVARFVSGDSNSVLLELRINPGVKIPRQDNIVCRENILGDTYVDISSGFGVTTRQGFYNEKDTVYATYVSLNKALDAAEKARIMKQLKKFKTALDSIVRRDSLFNPK